MSTTTITPNGDAVIGEIEIAAPPERVFQALTTGSELMRWFTNEACPARTWEFEPRVGGRYRSITEKGTVVVNGITEFECHGEILECDPPRLLVYTWIANWHEDVSRLTTVRWELAPKAGGTRLKVTHSGLTHEPIARKDYSGGWVGVIENLKKFVEK